MFAPWAAASRRVRPCALGPLKLSIDVMARKTHQHYIPQFYLRGFVDPSCPQHQEPYLWVYGRGCGRSRRRAPKNVAVEPHFYSVDTGSDSKDSRVEDLLSATESRASPIWTNLGERERELSHEERNTIAIFVACMSARVPGVRERMNAAVDQVSRMILSMTAAQYEDLGEQQRQQIGLSREELIRSAGVLRTAPPNG